ncbi:MAG: metal-dependent transcriptional regulator [Candidatus Bathyarchaeia archaeon]
MAVSSSETLQRRAMRAQSSLRTTAAYLEAIYRLQETSGLARTSRLARQMGVTPATVTGMLQKLSREGMVIHEPWRGVKLTDQGRRVALNALRKHRLAERLLTDMLQMDWSKVHEEACRLQRGIPDETLKPLEKALRHPRTCSHGNPIPTRCGGIIEEESEPLTNLGAEESAVIVRLRNEGLKVLQHLAGLGFKPGANIKIRGTAPDRQSMVVVVDGTEQRLPWEVASTIGVQRSRGQIYASIPGFETAPEATRG